jgi:hypothetical protein
MAQYDFIFCNLLNITLLFDNLTVIKEREHHNSPTPIKTFVLSRLGHGISLHSNT